LYTESYDTTGNEYEKVDSRLPSYWLTRFIILRLLGFVYAVAFLVLINQVLPLIGSNGLTPAAIYLKDLGLTLGSNGAGFMRLPSIFWFGHSDAALITFAWIGFLFACMVIAGYANALVMALLWLLYMSFAHIGQEWYWYGWEMQLTETGFLAIFLCPLLDGRSFPRYAPPMPVIILFRWLIFRIMLGAGLIKMRGDKIWRDATALYYHFETQPIPGPLSRWFHFLPHPVLKAGVWFNHIAELAAPCFVFWPRAGRHIAGVVIVLFQITLILSGNLSFLNWVTIVPALACFDDGFWSRILPRSLVQRAEEAEANSEPSKPMLTTAWVVTAIIGMLSIQPAFNLLSPRQIMNTSFDPFDLVNTYGAFGTVGQKRLNLVYEGTMDDDSTDKANWQPYVYRGLPVLLNKRPPQIAPYQLRLDWEMWFAAMGTSEDYLWTYNLAWKLLHNDPGAISLFAANPFPGKPPKFIRAVLYRYSFAKPGNVQGNWWKRERIRLWLPVMSANNKQLILFLKSRGWIQ
jgi:hypothetical protein